MSFSSNMIFDEYIQEKKEARLLIEKKWLQKWSTKYFFENILLGTHLREKYHEIKNEQQKKYFKCLYRTPAMLHNFNSRCHFI